MATYGGQFTLTIWQPEFTDKTISRKPGAVQTLEPRIFGWMDRLCEDYCGGIWNLYTLNNGGAFIAPEPDDDDGETWVLFNAMNGNRAEMSPEAAGIAACLMTYSHHACRTECYAMTVHYYRLRDYALQHPECSAIMRIID
ncbi:putative antirestriction protein [Escherichia coli]|nr:putative antirestriction protein [Escherichia coli]